MSVYVYHNTFISILCVFLILTAHFLLQGSRYIIMCTRATQEREREGEKKEGRERRVSGKNVLIIRELNETQHNLMFPDSENNCDSEFIQPLKILLPKTTSEI